MLKTPYVLNEVLGDASGVTGVRMQHVQSGALEDIALQAGWISSDKVRAIAAPMAKNPYGQFLLRQAEEHDKH